jgi:ribosomal protein S27E
MANADNANSQAQAHGTKNGGIEGILTLVCLTCGNEQFFTDKPPADEPCSRCGSTVFRSFFTPTVQDDATESMLDDTSRSITLEGNASDSVAGDVRDLDNL